jgi:hypothetical protein
MPAVEKDMALRVTAIVDRDRRWPLSREHLLPCKFRSEDRWARADPRARVCGDVANATRDFANVSDDADVDLIADNFYKGLA